MASILPGPALQYRRPSLGDKAVLLILLLVIVAFSVLVELRAAFMQRRMTDAGVYFRAAWAVRSGDDLYQVADDNDWHYNYPPLLAIVLTPLADAPAGVDRSALLPYPVSVALWFLVNMLCGLVAVHWLARALEESSPDPAVRSTPVGCQAWWRRRVVPLLICLPPVAHTLMRGQVNLIVLLLLAGMLAAHLRGRSFTAGVWLAGAICIKIIPAFLLVLPLWRRDGRFLKGCAAGLAVGLLAVPALVLGPARTVHSYSQLANAVLRPGLTHEGDLTRAKELTNMTGTASQSFIAVSHNTLHLDRATRPEHADPLLRMVALAAAGLLTLATLLAARRRLNAGGPERGAELMLTWGAVVLAMLFTSPISHMHYFCLCRPLVMALLMLVPPRGGALLAWAPLTVLFVTVSILPHVPEWFVLRDVGLVMYGGLMCWAAAMAVLLWPAPKLAEAADTERQPLAA